MITSLSVSATPGRRHSFVAKSATSSKGAGSFTALSVLAVPGGRHVFIAKSAVVPPTTETTTTGGGGGSGFYARSYHEPWQKYYDKKPVQQFVNDDNEVIEILTLLFSAGVI